ncbi:MAG TPA: hypothetical protein P5522_10150 [Spirochaetia bacterium]|nr:hypothetical protein [Spirochaetota bacterium]HRV29134.1 hypothetical protein [Spirochaetia bacterium]
MANEQNLRPQPIRTKEEAKRKGRAGGIASGEARREKKRLSELCAEALAAEYDIVIEREVRVDGKVVRQEKRKKLQGQALFNHVFGRILSRCDSTTVQLLKNIGDLTEGQRYSHEINQLHIDENDEAVQELLKKYGIKN